MTKDFRVTTLRTWLENDLRLQIKDFSPASSDASFRRYFRVRHQHGTHIVMDAPPERENIQAFIKIAGIFKQAKLNVPDILHINQTQGFLLLQDFGQHCYLDVLDSDNKHRLYQAAIDSLIHIQDINPQAHDLPVYDRRLLRTELEIFEQWFLGNGLQIPVSGPTRALLDHTWDLLIDSALQQPRICVHRDYHSRNLMQVAKNSPGILDFQDALLGPITYDLVSLLRDCYICWPEQQVEQWLDMYRIQSSLARNYDSVQFKRWFDLMGIQRHLKAIGIFARLKLRDAKPAYLQDIPRTLQYINTITGLYPELSPFRTFLQQQILPNTANLT